MPKVETDAEREALFWNTCVPMRIVLATVMTIAALRDIRSLQLVLAAYMGSWGVAFLANFVAKWWNEAAVRSALSTAIDPQERARLQIQLETTMYGNFGGVVWWQWPRLVHGALLVAYSAGTIFRWGPSYLFAIADVAFGVAAGFYHYRVRLACRFE